MPRISSSLAGARLAPAPRSEPTIAERWESGPPWADEGLGPGASAPEEELLMAALEEAAGLTNSPAPTRPGAGASEYIEPDWDPTPPGTGPKPGSKPEPGLEPRPEPKPEAALALPSMPAEPEPEPAVAPPGPPSEPWAAAMSSSSFCGSLSHFLNSSCWSPREAAASCAAMLASFSRESVATKQISLMRTPLAPVRACLSCWASSAGLALPVGNAWTKRPSSSCVMEEKNCTLAKPAADRSWANCFSAGEPSRGTPSRRS